MLQNSLVIKSDYTQPNRAFMNEMKLFVKSIDGEIFSFSMKNHDLIKDIKLKIYDKIGLNVEQQILCYQGAILEDMRELSDYEIINYSIIDVVGRLRGGMQIFIKLMNGNRIEIEIDDGDKIRNLKLKIKEKAGIPVNKQNLIYQGSILENNKTIREYQICEKSEISVAVKLGNDEIKIFVKTSEGNNNEIELAKSDKIFDLRCTIEEELKLCANEQKLVYRGVILDDDNKSINEYQICDQSVIDILAKIRISITTSGGKIARVEMFERDKIKDLKHHIEEKLALNLDKQILIFNDGILDDDDKSINEYQICDGSMIYLRCIEIEISAVMPNNSIIHFDALLTDKIEDIKKKIECKSGIPSVEQLLNYNGTILDDNNKTIDEYQIREKSVINLRRNIQIIVKISTEKSISVNVDESDKIVVLKNKIHDKTGIKSNEQNLIYQTVKLEDDKTISYYNMVNRCIINIVAKLKGGKFIPVRQKQIYLTSRKQNSFGHEMISASL